MPRNELQRALNPRAIAIFGASHDPGKFGNVIVRNLVEGGFAGEIHPINPRPGEIRGHAARRGLAEIEAEIDLAIVALPVERAADALRECAEHGVGAVVTITSGYGEMGEAGGRHDEELREILRDAPFRMIGPNCQGLAAPRNRVFASFSGMIGGLRDGPVAILSQSGALSGMIADRLAAKGVGVSALVSTGNETDVTVADLMEALESDEGTKVILIYAEQIRDPARFIRVARRLRGRKSIVMIKAGRSAAGSGAALSHTGALAGDDRVASGVLQELGVVRARDSAAAVDAAAALALDRRLSGKRVAVLSIAGGMAVEMADLLATSGFEVPLLPEAVQERLKEGLPAFSSTRNPIDLTSTALHRPELIARALETLLGESGIDAAAVILTYASDVMFSQAILDASRRSSKPVLVCWTGGDDRSGEALARLRDGGMPTFDAPARALTGFAALTNEGLVA